MEWGKTWPIAHRQPGAVLPPPPLSREQIHTMLVTPACFQPKSIEQKPLICFTHTLLFRQRNMSTLVEAVTASGGSCGVAVVAPAPHPPTTKPVDLDYTPPADGSPPALYRVCCCHTGADGFIACGITGCSSPLTQNATDFPHWLAPRCFSSTAVLPPHHPLAHTVRDCCEAQAAR
jgi:hypothetical protein